MNSIKNQLDEIIADHQLVDYNSLPKAPDLYEINYELDNYIIRKYSSDQIPGFGDMVGNIKDVIANYNFTAGYNKAYELWDIDMPGMDRNEVPLQNNLDYLKNEIEQLTICQNLNWLGSLMSQANLTLEKAIKLLKWSIAIEKRYHQSYMRIGEANVKLENYETGILFYKTALSIMDSEKNLEHYLTPGNGYRAWNYLGIGICVSELGSNEDGKKFFYYSKELAPEDFTAYLVYGFSSWENLINHYQ